jgi:hypothetical protein
VDFDKKKHPKSAKSQVYSDFFPCFFSKFHWSLGLAIRLGLIKEATKATTEAATCTGAAGLLAAAEETPKAAGRSG